MNTHKGILQKNTLIDNKFRITFFLKKGSYAESYRVLDKNNNIKFLKLIAYNKLHPTQLDEEGNILEIEILKNISHPNIVRFVDSNDIVIDNERYAYFVLDFISGETLADRMRRELTLPVFETKQIILGVLNGLNYLHNLSQPVIHNEITNLNVMLDLSGKIPIPKIIDFGYARYLHQSIKSFNKKGLNPFYLAPETFNKIFSPQSDIYSVGALFYHLIFGLPPWFVEISNYRATISDIEEIILNERKKPLKFPNADTSIDKQTLKVITKALQQEPENRFKSAKEFILAINGEIEIEIPQIADRKTFPIAKSKRKVKGKGFDAIAGMQELKETLKVDVIDALNEPDKYAEYGLTIPNGMLLYGPPGCGKTFFAEKLAEEVGFNFIKINPSDIASIYVHGTQEKIADIFKQARENAPCIIFIDEFDAMLPSRQDDISHSYASEVNEFLVQMSNTAESGVFVIVATNRPEKIDSAILRTGRIDKIFYVPPPDFEAREELFKIYLRNRPVDLGIDFKNLASLTENYVSSDIKFICDEAARIALKNNSRITSEILENVIKGKSSSISLSDLKQYENIRQNFENKNLDVNNKPRIGF